MNFFIYIFITLRPATFTKKKNIYCVYAWGRLNEHYFFSSSVTMSAPHTKKRSSEMRARTFISHHDRPQGTKKDVNNFYCKNLLMKLFKTTHTLFISSTISPIRQLQQQQFIFSYTLWWKWYSFNDFNFLAFSSKFNYLFLSFTHSLARLFVERLHNIESTSFVLFFSPFLDKVLTRIANICDDD